MTDSQCLSLGNLSNLFSTLTVSLDNISRPLDKLLTFTRTQSLSLEPGAGPAHGQNEADDVSVGVGDIPGL